MTDAERDEIAQCLLDELQHRRDEILADSTTPLRKLPLSRPIGRFDHLVVLSPTVVDGEYFTILGRSLWKAFPAFACEAVGDESVAVAEARTKGRSCIPSSRWHRAPHPVVDLRFIKSLAREQAADFLVYDPSRLERLLGGPALAKMRYEAVDARNYRLEVQRFAAGSAVEADHIERLREFFGFAPDR